MESLKKYVDPKIRLYSIIPLLTVFLFNDLVYWGAMAITSGHYHYDLTTDLDRMVPILPWTIIIYFGCYLFLCVNYIMMGHLGKVHFYKFITADMMSRVICGIFFLFLPTTNIRPELPAHSIFNPAMCFLWNVDEAANLFPSIHCLVSWFCYIGIRGKKQIPLWYRIFSCVMALAVFASTQTTKQHYLVDVIAAVVIAECCFWIACHSRIYIGIMNGFEKLNKRLGLYVGSGEEV